MSEWITTRIGDLLRLSNERSISNDQYPVLTSSRSGLHLQSEYFNRIVASKDNTGYKVIRNGQFTYRAMSDDGFFRFNRLTGHEAGIISPAYEVFECNTKNADPEYMDYLLNSGIVLSQIYGAAQGGTRLSLRFSTLSEFEVYIPPLPEQKKIAEILSGIDACIALIKLEKKKSEQTLEAISAEVFGRLTTSDPATQLSDVCTLITKGATPTTFGHKLHGTAFQGSVTFLGGGSTSEVGEFDLRPARYCTQDAVGTLKRSQLSEGDTLVTIVGASIGNTCQIPKSVLPANINQNVALTRSDEAVLDKSFLNLFLRTEGRRMLVNIATTQAQPSVSLVQVGQLKIPMPNLGEQRRIVSAVEGIRESISLLDEKICKSEQLKEALLNDLLSGRRRVSV